MGLMLGPFFVVLFAVTALVLFNAANIDPAAVLTPFIGEQVAIYAVVAVAGVVGFLAWWYSPLPAHNGGFGLPPARLQKWGFTSEPRHDDYEDPESSDYGPTLKGFSRANREEEE